MGYLLILLAFVVALMLLFGFIAAIAAGVTFAARVIYGVSKKQLHRKETPFVSEPLRVKAEQHDEINQAR